MVFNLFGLFAKKKKVYNGSMTTHRFFKELESKCGRGTDGRFIKGNKMYRYQKRVKGKFVKE